jgi:hypothetical protein
VRRVDGASNVYPEPVTSGQYLNITVDREAAARYGLTVGAVQDVIEYGIGETVLSMTIEGRQRFPIRVRYAPEFRIDPETIGETLITGPAGQRVPLRAVARIEQVRGPAMISSENGLLLATVLLNVQGRDVGGFVEEARAAVARDVTLPAGYYLGWSGRYENQARARQRLQIVMPIVLLVIFILLYFTYGSLIEAAHVLLAVPFALTGGVYLLWLLGYNFSVAVWVGFIALFGTAVQTGVVMVIYLEEAVARKRDALGGVLTRAALRDAVREGALLRLRPKVMTVSTVVAGLLPIMWSTRPGAEVMKPLATPVLGGMVSSLVHVLIVTPVIFYWIRARRLTPDPVTDFGSVTPSLGPAVETREPATGVALRRGRLWTLIAAGALVAALAGVWLGWGRSQPNTFDAPIGVPIQTLRSGDLEVSVTAPDGAIRQGRSSYVIEFRSASTKKLVDVGTVRASAAMPMPGMVMSGGVRVSPAGTVGRYIATGEFGMAGAWQMTIEWNGPAGRGLVSFEGEVQ